VYIFYLHSPCKKYIYKKTNFTLWKIILAPPMREEIEQRRPNWDDYIVILSPFSPHMLGLCVDSQPMWDDLQYWLLQDSTMFLSWMAEGAVYEGCIVPIRLHCRPMMKLALLQCCRMHQHSFIVFSVRGRHSHEASSNRLLLVCVGMEKKKTNYSVVWSFFYSIFGTIRGFLH
jgi:hypothetical protein